MTSSPSPGPATPRSRRWLPLAAAGACALVAVVWIGLVVLQPPSPPPPIPVPTRLSDLDPQVRDYLARLASRVAQQPRDRELRSELGLALAVNGLWTEARQSFHDAIRLGDAGPLPALYAAVARLELGDPDGARSELEALVRQHPDSAPAWYRLALIRATAGDLASARAAFEQVTRLAPSEWRGWAGLGETFLREGGVSLALPPLERAVSLDPFARAARFLLGQAYTRAGRTNEAALARSAGQARTLSPMPDAWSVRALDHMRLLPDQFERVDHLLANGRVDEAVARLREARRFHPANPSVAARFARALVAAGQIEPASSLLVDARKTAPDDVELLVEASATAAAAGRAAEALELARRAVALAPRSADPLVAEANALLAAEQDRAAAAALERAIEISPAHVGLRVQLGDIQLHNLGLPEEALTTFRRARELDPIHPPVIERLAERSITLGDLAEATSLLAELRRLQHDPARVAELESALDRARSRPSE